MEKRIESKRALLESLLVDLEYVVRISSLYGLIGCRAYIEKILDLILEEKSVNNDNFHLIDKIDVLEKKRILQGRLLAEIQTIRYMGNDATHKLIGSESEAASALLICKKFKDWYLNNCSDEVLKDGQEYCGIIKKYGKKNYGFIKESTTAEDIFFTVDNNSMISKRIREGQIVKFIVEHTNRKTPYKAVELKLTGTVKNIDKKNGHRYGFVDGESNEDIYFSISNLNEGLRNELKIGIEIAFKLRKGSRNDVAYDIELL